MDLERLANSALQFETEEVARMLLKYPPSLEEYQKLQKEKAEDEKLEMFLYFSFNQAFLMTVFLCTGRDKQLLLHCTAVWVSLWIKI